MDYAQSLAVLVTVYMVSLISPGPNFIVVTSTSMSVSRSAGLFSGLGLAAASLTWAVLAMAGMGWLVSHFGWLRLMLQVAGALYLMGLGVKLIRNAKQPLQAPGRVEPTRMAAMRRAYIVSMTNPKSVVFFGSIFAVVLPAHAPPWFYGLVATTTLLMSACWYCGLAVLFSRPSVTNGFVRFKARIERLMGLALIILGGRLLWAR